MTCFDRGDAYPGIRNCVFLPQHATIEGLRFLETRACQGTFRPTWCVYNRDVRIRRFPAEGSKHLNRYRLLSYD